MKPLRLVIGGGIGSGKSQAGGLLVERGFAVLDADRVGHSILEGDHPVARRVAERWPAAVTGGTIDRRALARIVFRDRDQLAELEAITHPAIRQGVAAWARQVGDRPLALEVPILAELAGGDWIWVIVEAPLELRKERLRERGMSDGEIAARVAAQPSREEWLEAADYVIDNEGTQEHLARALDDALARIRTRPRAGR
ncbi:MAG: dephospho-CoA kinase [bacterium]|nr:dephospho-CoA kinase [bacterium]MDE0353037.1 dephospho-CoA kinase [bacterium]